MMATNAWDAVKNTLFSSADCRSGVVFITMVSKMPTQKYIAAKPIIHARSRFCILRMNKNGIRAMNRLPQLNELATPVTCIPNCMRNRIFSWRMSVGCACSYCPRDKA